MEDIKPSDFVKKLGLKSLKELSDLSGESVQNLYRWYADNRRRFDLILKAVLFEVNAMKMEQRQQEMNAMTLNKDGDEEKSN